MAVYIAADSDRAAESVEASIHKEAKLLSRFPRSGRIGRAPGTRERVVARTPYILVYRIVSVQSCEHAIRIKEFELGVVRRARQSARFNSL